MWQETRGDPHTHCEKTCFRDAKFGGLSWLFSFVSCEDYNVISRSRRSFHRLTVIVKPGKYIVCIKRSGLRTTLSKILFQLNSVPSLVFTIEGDYIV